jgi:hypothetical protein
MTDRTSKSKNTTTAANRLAASERTNAATVERWPKSVDGATR